jgi:uncharacterized protein YbaA (DUF1428 family)
MSYVDGYLIPVKLENKDAYLRVAAKAAPIFRDHGALRVVECWGDDVPAGKTTDFFRAVKAEPGEVIVFSWIEWPSKAVRDAGMKKAMEDPRMDYGSANTPFDGKRMIFGGFAPLLDTAKTM